MDFKFPISTGDFLLLIRSVPNRITSGSTIRPESVRWWTERNATATGGRSFGI